MPNKQVVIEFVGDYSKLEAAQQELQKSGLSEQQVKQFSQINEASAAAAENVGKIGAAAKESESAMGRLAAATNSAAKGVVGAAGKQALDGLRTAAQSATGELGKFSSGLDLAKTKLAALTPGTAAFKQLSSEIKATELAMAALGNTAQKLETGTASVREQTRTFTNAMVQLKQAGLDNTEVYKALKGSLAELQLSVQKVGEEVGGIASETKNLGAVIEGAEGVAGAFEAAAGASAIFGERSDDLEKTTQRVFAAMALANGIQKVYNVTLKESAVVQAIARGQAALQAVSTRLAAAAESEYVVIRVAATAAQAALNAVMAANPVVLLVGALIAAGAALYAFTSESDKAAEAQKKLIEEEKLQLDYLEEYQKNNTSGQRERITQLQNELTLLKSKNVSQSVILAKEKEITEAERVLAGNNHGFYAQEVKDVQQLGLQIEDLKSKLLSLQREKDGKQSGNFFTRWLYGERSNDDIDKDIDNTKGKLENLQRQQEQGQKAKEEADAKIAEDNAKAEEIRKHNVEEELKDQEALAQAKLAKTRKGSEDELNAEIGLIQRKQALELNDANLTADQRLAIEEQNARQIRELRDAYNLKIAKEDLAIYQAYAQGRLQIVAAGSREELDLELQLLAQKRDVDMLAAKDDIRQQQQIRLQFENDTNAKIKAYLRQQNIDAIEAERLTNKAKLDIVQQGTHEEYELKLQEVEIEKRAAIAAIDDRVKNTAKGQAEINEITQKALGEQAAIRRAYLQEEITDETNQAKTVNDIRISRLAGLAGAPGTSANQQFQLQQEQREIELQNIALEEKENQKLYENKLETQEEYVQRSLELENQRVQKQAEIDNAEAGHRRQFLQQIIDLSIDSAQKIADTTFEINDNSIKQQEDNQIAALDRDKAATLSQKFLTNQQKAVIDESYRRQQIAIERQAAIKKRDNDENQAEVDGFLAIAKVWAEHADDPILAAILTAVAIAQTTEQVAKIKSTPLPAYATGTEMVEGPGGPTSDSIIARLSRGERVVSAEINRKYFPALSAIHNETVPPALANNLLTMPLMPAISAEELDRQSWMQGSAIDYDRLGQAVARYMGAELGELPLTSFSFDERGFIASVKKGLDTTTYLSKRYSSRK